VSSILDVARLAGVSPSTAKRAVREPDRLTKQTLERVQSAIRTLNYEPNQTAGALRSGRSNTVGLLVGNIIEPFFTSLVRTIAREVRAAQHALIVADSEYDTALELEHLRMFHGQRVGALIIRSAFGAGNLEYLERLRDQGTYILEIDHFLAQSQFSHIMLDNRQGVLEGVQHLHRLGHERIAALSTYHPQTLQDERAKAFPEILETLGLTLPESYQHVGEISEAAAYMRTKELMGLKHPPTAIFALTGTEGAGAFRALRELGLRIAEDVSLVSWDDYSWTSLVTPAIDVIQQPVEDMGVAAARAALTQRFVQQRFAPRLIVRGSSAGPRSSQVGSG
jgi:LacI family transcriptional regulator